MTAADGWAAMVAAIGVVCTGASVLGIERAQASGRVRARVGSGGPSPVAPAWFARALVLAEVRVDPARAWPVARRVGVPAAVLGAVAAPTVAVLLVVVAVGVALRAAPAVRRRAEQRGYDVGLVAAVEAISAALRSGGSLVQAVAAAGGGEAAAARDLAQVARRQQRGEPLQPLLDRWAAARSGTGAALVADALALATGAGGSSWRALAGVGASLRERAALQREVRALAAQARASAVVLVVAPLGFGAAAAAADRRLASFLLATPAGWACLGGGLLLDVVGAAWMAHQLRAVA